MFLLSQWSLHPGRKVCYPQRRALVSRPPSPPHTHTPLKFSLLFFLGFFVEPLCLDTICVLVFVVCALMDSSTAIYGRPNCQVRFIIFVHNSHLWLIKCTLIKFPLVSQSVRPQKLSLTAPLQPRKNLICSVLRAV